MNKLVFIPALVAALSIAGCQRAAEDYISIKGKVFIFNIRLARAYYQVALNRLEKTPDDAVVVAEFENPEGGPPLVVEQKVFPRMSRIDLQSPDLNCVVVEKPYAITLTLKSADGAVLQEIDTTLTSTIDQTALPRGLWFWAQVMSETRMPMRPMVRSFSARPALGDRRSLNSSQRRAGLPFFAFSKACTFPVK